ncbi:GNAT family N-acetyltransferase [Actinacidiphila glaucinigra]
MARPRPARHGGAVRRSRSGPLHTPTLPIRSGRRLAYLARAHERRAEGRIQLAITTDGQQPLGEILLVPADTGETYAELAYAVGPRHRRRRLATRAVQLITTHARTYLGVRHILLRIPEQKTASAAVARAAVAPPTTREGARDLRRTWQHRP